MNPRADRRRILILNSMRKTWLIPLLATTLVGGPPPQPAAKEGRKPEAAPVDFAAQVRPILERCQPCHFKGGTVYGKYPFDAADTVHLLGKRLFTRLKDEKDRTVIRAFLAQAH